MRKGLQRSLKAGPSGKEFLFLLKSANVSPMCLCFSCKYLVSTTSSVITLCSSRFVDPLTSLISLRVAQRSRMEFKPKLFASGVPTTWCPNVSGSRCLGVSVSQCYGWCLGVPVSRVFYNVFSNCFLDTCIQATMGQSCSCTVCMDTVLPLPLQCVCTVSSVFTCCQHRFSV